MRIVHIEVSNWRNLQNIVLSVPPDAPLVALVGENGTGKSNLLELISASAHDLGIAHGVDNPRGNPFNEPHSVRVQMHVPQEPSALLGPTTWPKYSAANPPWDGTLWLESSLQPGQHPKQRAFRRFAGGIEERLRDGLATHVIAALKDKLETLHLCLDADRAYPPMEVNVSQYGEAMVIDWDAPQQRKSKAHTSSRVKYGEWMQFCVGSEGKLATEYLQNCRRAEASGQPHPAFHDQFGSFSAAIRQVLPHLEFRGVDQTLRTLVFDSSGTELRFTQLSGGEREIAFILGQIDRFQLRRGLLLIDEPELHLNPDMVRNWVAYLRDTVEEGQVWVSTHSMEAVEAATPEYTFVLEREPATRIVRKADPLAGRPVLSVLSAAVGSPAFSLADKSFVFVEGDRSGVERDLFYRLYALLGDTKAIRFMEGGGCQEVCAKVDACRELATEANEALIVGGVVDRDFRDTTRCAALSKRGVLVLPVHEVENLFLQPAGIENLARKAGITGTGHDIIKSVADRFAGQWALGRAVEESGRSDVVGHDVRKAAGQLHWAAIDGDPSAAIGAIVGPIGGMADKEAVTQLTDELAKAIQEYARPRDHDGFWKVVNGKQVLGVVPKRVGLADRPTFVGHIISAWEEAEVAAPPELSELGKYIEGLRPQDAQSAGAA